VARHYIGQGFISRLLHHVLERHGGASEESWPSWCQTGRNIARVVAGSDMTSTEWCCRAVQAGSSASKNHHRLCSRKTPFNAQIPRVLIVCNSTPGLVVDVEVPRPVRTASSVVMTSIVYAIYSGGEQDRLPSLSYAYSAIRAVHTYSQQDNRK
jgi:hypothetical protein